MGHIVIAAYRPKAGKDDELLALTRGHHARLAAEGLVTLRVPVIMRSTDGTVVEVFEWVSKASTEEAHSNPAVLAMWQEYAAVCDYVSLPQLPESNDLFAGFSSVD